MHEADLKKNNIKFKNNRYVLDSIAESTYLFLGLAIDRMCFTVEWNMHYFKSGIVPVMTYPKHFLRPVVYWLCRQTVLSQK